MNSIIYIPEDIPLDALIYIALSIGFLVFMTTVMWAMEKKERRDKKCRLPKKNWKQSVWRTKN